jgi:hypothetical protein
MQRLSLVHAISYPTTSNYVSSRSVCVVIRLIIVVLT